MLMPKGGRGREEEDRGLLSASTGCMAIQIGRPAITCFKPTAEPKAVE